MRKVNKHPLVKEKTPSEQNVREVAKKVIENCRTALAAKNLIKKNQISVKQCSPKLSLDKVSEDIKNILSQLGKDFSKPTKHPPKPVELKLQQKEFFRLETARKTRTQKSSIKRKPSNQSTHNSSMNFFKAGRSSKNSDNSSVRSVSISDSVNTIRSSTIFKKVPVTKSELQNFKHKIELTALESIKSPELLRLVDKEKVARHIKSLMKEALESEKKHQVPVIDLGEFINSSMKLSICKDLADVKRVAGARIDMVSTDTGDQIQKREEIYNSRDINGEAKSAKNEKIDSFISSSQNCKKKLEENQANKKSSEAQHVGQKSGSKGPPARNNSTMQAQSKTTGNLTAKMKPSVQKNTNVKVVPQKTAAKGKEQVANSKMQVTNNKNVRPSSADKGNERSASQAKVRSNSTLSNSYSSAIRNSNLARPSSNQSSRDSQRPLMSAPVKSFSASSSRCLRGSKTSTSGFGASSHSYFGRMSVTNSGVKRNVDPIVQLKEEVNRAIRDKKTFTVSGQYPAIRRALVRRGWIEKYTPCAGERLQGEMNSLRHKSILELVDLMQVKDLNEICKKLIRSKMLGSHQVDLYWGHNYESFKINNDKVKLTKINKFRRDVFSYTSKQGLCDAVKTAHWFNFPGLARINHPRTYSLARNGETKEFFKDFRRTAAMSLLKWIVRSHETKECKIISLSGKIPLEAFQFACNECYKMLIEANNQDIDQPLNEAQEHEWSQFLEYYYKILHIGNHFKLNNTETEESIVEKSEYLINKLAAHYPHIRMDGTMNIWILKPAVGSQGKGIHICRTLQYITNTVKSNSTIKYIAQKYIERPLLIFNTKFDIRQWFLISSALPLTIWMYRECYLRFSSQTYNLRKLHESVHLTNNSVQKHYQNMSYDITLPKYNMWDSIQFRNYLSNIGYPEIYRKVIYKGMKECIVGAVMIHQDKIDKRRNCFELYGADFMLTEDFQPWLIEINSSPALFASTPITSRMCPQVLEDTIKVVVDHAANSKARTGNFELVYQQPNLQCNNNANINSLKVSGKPLPKNYFCLEEDKNAKRIAPLSITENVRMEKSMSKSKSEILTEGVKETLENLLKFIQTEKTRRQKKKLITKGTSPILPVQESIEDKSSSSTSTNLSFASLKSNLNILAGSNKIYFTKEDENLLDQALKMLRSNRESEVVKYLLEILERIANRATPSEA